MNTSIWHCYCRKSVLYADTLMFVLTRTFSLLVKRYYTLWWEDRNLYCTVSHMTADVVVTPTSWGTWEWFTSKNWSKWHFIRSWSARSYLSEGRNLLLNTRNNSGDSPSLGTSSPTIWNGSKRSGNFSRVTNSGLARMSVASPSQIGRMSLGDSYVTRHGRKSVTSQSWNWSRVATFAESHRRDIRASRVTREWLVSDIGSTCKLWPITWLMHPLCII